MGEKKKGKKRKEGFVPAGEEIIDKPGKDEYNLAKWMRKNVPIKKTKFMNHIVEYFTAAKALDALLESKYASGDNALFTNREDAVDYLQMMLEHKFFHRARKIPVSEAELKGKKKDKKALLDSPKEEKKDEKKDKEEKKDDKKEKDKNTDAESSVVEGKPDTTNSEKVQRKRKIRLDMHNEQIFVDGLDAYVWIYDPIPFHCWVIGTLLVLGAIGVCLFPLWPPSVHRGVYYLSVAAAGFLVFIILLVIVRLIIFCLVWMLTAGKHHIWILPNLTEDVGILASFYPLYKYEYKGSETVAKKKKKKEKDSDAENEDDPESKTDTEPLLSGSSKTDTSEAEARRDTSSGTTPPTSPTDANQPSESESESSQRSSTGKDFEMVDKDEDFDEDAAES